ncbi:VanW family protein [Haloimpatiens sp. FM7315]|uniref:VanW family protein n=1 Tax=Haloimpatiens sp. FM7315 TaxID=3298609 RepID=UPI0035A34CCA
MKKKFTFFICILLVLSVTFLGCNSAEEEKHNQDPNKKEETTKASNVYIEDILINDKSKEETEKILKEKYIDESFKKKITILCKDKSYELTLKDLKVNYNKDKIIKEAYEALENKSESKKLKLTLNYDKTSLDSFVNKLSKETYKKESNARFSIKDSSKIEIIKEQTGLDLDKTKLKNDIISNIISLHNLKENPSIKASIKETSPKITSEKLKSINSKISSFSTTLSGSKERVNNITLGAKHINGTLLMPGENFSFYNSIGLVSKKTGFMEAPAIIDNELKPSVGGGLCQVATTLYNSILRANITYTERSKHSIPPKYVAPGLDTTVFGSELDYKFKNTLKYPIYIEGSVKDNKITFTVFSNSSLNSYKYDYTSSVYAKVPNSTKYIKDSSMPKGKEIIDKPGSTGLKVKVYKITLKGGKQISKKLFYEDYYKPLDKIVKVGV